MNDATQNNDEVVVATSVELPKTPMEIIDDLQKAAEAAVEMQTGLVGQNIIAAVYPQRKRMDNWESYNANIADTRKIMEDLDQDSSNKNRRVDILHIPEMAKMPSGNAVAHLNRSLTSFFSFDSKIIVKGDVHMVIKNFAERGLTWPIVLGFVVDFNKRNRDSQIDIRRFHVYSNRNDALENIARLNAGGQHSESVKEEPIPEQ